MSVVIKQKLYLKVVETQNKLSYKDESEIDCYWLSNNDDSSN